MKTIEMHDLSDDFEEARLLVEELLKRNTDSGVIISETMLIFETLCRRIFEHRANDDVTIIIKTYERLGEASIIFSFEGGMYDPEPEDVLALTPEERILKAY